MAKELSLHLKEIVMSERIASWITKASRAASGGNAQPWDIQFEESDSQIAFRISIDKQYQKDPSIMDVAGVASALSIGCFGRYLVGIALLENFDLVNKKFNDRNDLWASSVELLFEKNENSNSEKNKPNIQEPFHQTNRYPYKKIPLDKLFEKQLEEKAARYSTIKLLRIDKEDQNFKQALNNLETVRWINYQFLESLFKEITTSDTQQLGIPVAQLGVSFLEENFIKFLKNNLELGFSMLNFGLHKATVQKNTENFLKNCSQVYFLQAADFSLQACFDLGYCFQDLWIEVNSQKLSFQPNGNGFVALAHWHTPNNKIFNQKEIRMIEDSTQLLNQSSGLNLKVPVIGFRIGYSNKAIPLSPRRPLKGRLEAGLINSFSPPKMKSN